MGTDDGYDARRSARGSSVGKSAYERAVPGRDNPDSSITRMRSFASSSWSRRTGNSFRVSNEGEN